MWELGHIKKLSFNLHCANNKSNVLRIERDWRNIIKQAPHLSKHTFTEVVSTFIPTTYTRSNLGPNKWYYTSIVSTIFSKFHVMNNEYSRREKIIVNQVYIDSFLGMLVCRKMPSYWFDIYDPQQPN
jgi:hypothetical protein